MSRQYPRTKLYLSILQQELISLEGLSRLPAVTEGESLNESRRFQAVTESIEEIEELLALAQERTGGGFSGLSLPQYWLVFLVMVGSGLLMGAGLWASLILR